MYRHFILNSGYVEESTMAHVLLTKCDGTFGDITGAMRTFVDGLAAEKGFDNTNPDEVYDAILEFLDGDMQTHGYFLFAYEWNVLCLTDIADGEVVVCIDRAAEVIRDVYFGTADQHTIDCFISCIEITAKTSNHKIKLISEEA